MTDKILTLTSEMSDLRSKWKTLSLYERFEQTVVSFLTLVIAVIIALATWQLLLHTIGLVESHMVDPADSQVFQGLDRKSTRLNSSHSSPSRMPSSA